jgi:hypothetical protein
LFYPIAAYWRTEMASVVMLLSLLMVARWNYTVIWTVTVLKMRRTMVCGWHAIT